MKSFNPNKDRPRISSISNKTKSVTACNDSLKSKTLNVNVVCATCGKCLADSNHFACVTKILKDVNARTKKYNLVPISTRKPNCQANKSVATPPKKTVASESTTQKSKSYYRMLYKRTSKAWKWWIEQQCPSGYKWVPKTKMKWVPKVRNEHVKKRVRFAIDNASDYDNSGPIHQLQNVSPSADTTVPLQQESDLLFGPLYDEFFNAGTSSVNKSSSPTNNSTQQDTLPLMNIHPTSEPSTPTNVHAEENNDNQTEDEFTNPFCTLESSIWIEASSKSMAKYALEILKKHGMEKGQSIGTPMATKPKLDADLSGTLVDQTDYHSKIGSLMYLTSSRPDIVQAYPKGSSFELTTFSDIDHAGCIDICKSTSRGIQFLGDKLVSWMSKKQDSTAISLTEAEYLALSSAIAISCNPVQHSCTKHIHTGYHFIKEQVENDIIELYLVRTEYQLADMFTKALLEDRFQYLVRRIGMRCLTPAELEVLENESALYTLQTSTYCNSDTNDKGECTHKKQIRLKRDKSEQNRTKTGSVAKPEKVKSSCSG
nr:hypothetical protein [Tanacetum cinerariifolium]